MNSMSVNEEVNSKCNAIHLIQLVMLVSNYTENYWNLDFPNFQGKQKFVRKIECIKKLEIELQCRNFGSRYQEV